MCLLAAGLNSQGKVADAKKLLREAITKAPDEPRAVLIGSERAGLSHEVLDVAEPVRLRSGRRSARRDATLGDRLGGLRDGLGDRRGSQRSSPRADEHEGREPEDESASHDAIRRGAGQ